LQQFKQVKQFSEIQDGQCESGLLVASTIFYTYLGLAMPQFVAVKLRETILQILAEVRTALKELNQNSNSSDLQSGSVPTLVLLPSIPFLHFPQVTSFPVIHSFLSSVQSVLEFWSQPNSVFEWNTKVINLQTFWKFNEVGRNDQPDEMMMESLIEKGMLSVDESRRLPKQSRASQIREEVKRLSQGRLNAGEENSIKKFPSLVKYAEFAVDMMTAIRAASGFPGFASTPIPLEIYLYKRTSLLWSHPVYWSNKNSGMEPIEPFIKKLLNRRYIDDGELSQMLTQQLLNGENENGWIPNVTLVSEKWRDANFGRLDSIYGDASDILYQLLSRAFESATTAPAEEAIQDPFTNQSNSTKPTQSTMFHYASYFFWQVAQSLELLGKDHLSMEYWMGDQNQVCEQIVQFRQRPLQPDHFSRKPSFLYDRVFLSNVPDYTGHYLLLTHPARLLKSSKSQIIFNCLRNTGIWKSVDSLLWGRMRWRNKNEMKLIGLQLVNGSMWENFRVGSVNRSVIQTLFGSSESPIRRVDVFVWLLNVFLQITFPIYRSPSEAFTFEGYSESLVVFFEIVQRLADLGVPAHWLIPFMEHLLTNEIGKLKISSIGIHPPKKSPQPLDLIQQMNSSQSQRAIFTPNLSSVQLDAQIIASLWIRRQYHQSDFGACFSSVPPSFFLPSPNPSWFHSSILPYSASLFIHMSGAIPGNLVGVLIEKHHDLVGEINQRGRNIDREGLIAGRIPDTHLLSVCKIEPDSNNIGSSTASSNTQPEPSDAVRARLTVWLPSELYLSWSVSSNQYSFRIIRVDTWKAQSRTLPITRLQSAC